MSMCAGAVPRHGRGQAVNSRSEVWSSPKTTSLRSTARRRTRQDPQMNNCLPMCEGLFRGLFKAKAVYEGDAGRDRAKGRGGRGRGKFIYTKSASKAMNVVDAGRDRATPAWVRHDADLSPLALRAPVREPEEGGKRLKVLLYYTGRKGRIYWRPIKWV